MAVGCLVNVTRWIPLPFQIMNNFVISMIRFVASRLPLRSFHARRAARQLSQGRCFGTVGALVIVAGSWTLSASAAAETSSAGGIEGRIVNASSGNYLNNARVVVRGTTLATTTNEVGEYRLAGVPAGDASLAVTFAGMEAQVTTIRVAAGQTVQRDFALTLAGQDKIVQLAVYTVAEREMSGQAIALQERRNAPNIKNVISLEEFGDMGEGNVGEFLKFVPGISMAYNPQTPQSAGIRVTSPRSMLTSGSASRVRVTSPAKISRSTASAEPAGTLAPSAARITSEPMVRISWCSRPTALVSTSSERRELEQTSSARPSVAWASVARTGRISCSTTRWPARAICQAASEPARPPPIT